MENNQSTSYRLTATLMPPASRTWSLLPILGMIALLSLPLDTSAAILITRIQIESTRADDEFIDIANTGTTPTSLEGFSLKKLRANPDGTCKEAESLVSPRTAAPFTQTLAPGETLRIGHPSSDAPDIDLTYSKSASISDNTALTLFDDKNQELDTVGYGAACTSETAPAPKPGKNERLVRKESDGNYQDTDNNATDFSIEKIISEKDPGKESGIYGTDSLRLNEILPNPKGDETQGEFIELFNGGNGTINLKGWTLRDASKTGHYTFPEETLVEPGGFLTLFRTVFKFALNNSNETVTLLDSSGAIVSQTSYAKTRENVSYNFSGSGWRHSRFLTPDAANILNDLPDTKTHKPKEAYIGVTARFSVKAKDRNGDPMKYVWDFGDGHKSYKRDTTHTYKKKGRYVVTITTSDGSEEKIDSFRITVKKYPESKVRIVRLVPNPTGRDTENEWIEISNLSKKTVKLKDWKIATKSPTSKDFINHSVLTDIRLKPGETKRITRADSRFSLHNKSTTIALRNPAGKTLQKIAYAEASSVGEDVAYARSTPSATDNAQTIATGPVGWQWIALTTKTAGSNDSLPIKNQASADPTRFIANTSDTTPVYPGNRSTQPGAPNSPLFAAAERQIPRAPMILGSAIARPSITPSNTATDIDTPLSWTDSFSHVFVSFATTINAWIGRFF